MSNGDSTEKAESRLTVLDAGPIIHLDELGCLDLLEGLGALQVPAAVWNEVLKYRRQSIEAAPPQIAVIHRDAPISSKLAVLAKRLNLDAGECRALALLEQSQGTLFLCDDAAARLACETLGMEVRGTIGLIVRAIRRGTRSRKEVRSLLTSIPQKSTLYINQSLLNRIIRELD